MAIEVISKEPHPSVLKTVVCRKCGWEHRYAPIDVHSAVQHDYGGGSDTWWFIRCANPQCIDKERNFTGNSNATDTQPMTNYIEVPRP